MSETIAMILAGGQGSRLSILSEQRAKPAVPFGGNYRIIDFSISNVMHSGIRFVGVMTQYKPYSLMAHIGMGEAWGFSARRSAAKILPPYVGDKASDWYAGTADAVYQNLWFTRRFEADTVLVLSGDHIYHMLYNEVIEFHHRNKADLTLITQRVPWEEAGRYGVLQFDKNGRINAFVEKPKGRPPSNQINLGIYVFRKDVLERYLRDDANHPGSEHDFGHNIIPRMVNECRCFAMEFPHYWRDVGTLQSYWEANMECLDPAGGLNLADWQVHTNWSDIPLNCSSPARIAKNGRVVNSIVGKGSTIRGRVVDSVLFRGVEVGEGAEVRGCVLMDGVRVGAGARVCRTIADKRARFGPGAQAGSDEPQGPVNEAFPHYLTTGLTLVGKETSVPMDVRVGANCLLYPFLEPDDFTDAVYPAGSTVFKETHGEN